MPDSWVHRDLEIENLKLGSGSTVCAEASIDVGIGASDTAA